MSFQNMAENVGIEENGREQTEKKGVRDEDTEKRSLYQMRLWKRMRLPYKWECLNTII